MKKFSIIIFTLILGFSTAAAQTSDIQDTFFGVRFGTSQEAAESILERKGIYALSNYNQLFFSNILFGGYEWTYCSMSFNSFGLYDVSLGHNFKTREDAIYMFNRLFFSLSEKYGPHSPISDSDSLNNKFYTFFDDERSCMLHFTYGESKGGDMYYYVNLIYNDGNLYLKTANEL